jgi:arylsulfatase A
MNKAMNVIHHSIHAVLLAGVCMTAHAAQQPNIVILFADDMGYGEVHGLNPKRGKVPTPNLDKMIKDGMYFSDAHTASSVCTPSRYALLTGRYPWRTRLQKGVLTGHGEPLIAADRLTLPGMLKQKGYSTAIAGKWHLNFHVEGEGVTKGNAPIGSTIPDGPLTRGFDTYFGFHHARDMKTLIHDDKVIEIIDVSQMLPRVTDFAVDYINEHAAAAKNGNPFFLYVPFGSPHTPIVPTEEWIGKSGLGTYGDFVMMTDGMAGRVINAIDANGLTDNTLIFFSTDNGTSKAADIPALQKQGHYPSANLRGSKADLWDGGHRVPFITRWPGGGVKAGTSSDQLIGLSDMTATIAELVDYSLPETSAEDSISFLPALSGKPVPNAREAIIHHSISGHFSIRRDNWKLLLVPGSGGWSSPRGARALAQGLPKIQLYDMDKDLSEEHNLQAQNPEKVAQLLALLEEYVAKGRSTPGIHQTNDAQIDIWKKKTKKKS